MIVDLNARPRQLDDGTTLAELLEQVTGSLRGSAVVVDGAVVPRADWATYRLVPGQAVEVITAVQGG